MQDLGKRPSWAEAACLSSVKFHGCIKKKNPPSKQLKQEKLQNLEHTEVAKRKICRSSYHEITKERYVIITLIKCNKKEIIR